ncbi:DUF1934 domain-containing protein [Enterococcus ratti]|uniref:DUF1934 domain-containing protein n=1 Tax=Enterococcus ratti TaxID=150033 RepID=A0A1L8WPZ1_9ENTE|nr:DUF1934 domain-containing protein [Enterococcus ratti]OJG83093.1 hypothetical protein RV14_GL001788 [Enterococcus ratti]
MEQSQGTPISIKLRTKVQQNGEYQDFFFDLKGQMVKIGDTLYIRYQEIQENTEEKIPVTIKLMPDGHVQLIRSGEMRMRLKFGYRERLETTYRTPYGMFQIATFTKALHVSLKDRPTAGKVIIEYELFMGLEKLGEYYLTLDFTA